MEYFLVLQNHPEFLRLAVGVVVLALLYLARNQAHRSIRALCRLIANGLRLSANSVLRAEKKLVRRNREVLLAGGMKKLETGLEREFQRIETVVQRDFQGYPSFHRKMAELMTRIDEDYAHSTELPLLPADWISAVQAFADLPADRDRGVAMVLGDIHKTLEKHQKTALEEYRKQSAVRHGLLKKIKPSCRDLAKTLGKVGKGLAGLEERAQFIDQKMTQYLSLRADPEAGVRRLTSSSTVQFVGSGFLMLIALGGVVINFNLIALPLSEITGKASHIGPFPTANVAALVIVLTECSLGLLFMEALRITRLFPQVASLDDRLRGYLLWSSLVLLCGFAGIGAGIAYLQDALAAAGGGLDAGGVETAARSGRDLVASISHMALAFILPFTLSFAAIPLVVFVRSSRTVLGFVSAWLLQVVVFALRLLGHLVYYSGRFLEAVYDLVIAPFLWVERKIAGDRPRGVKAVPEKETG